MNKKEKELRRRQEDAALTRALFWVLGAIVMEFLVILVKRTYISFPVLEWRRAEMVHHILSGVRVAGLIAGIALIVWAVLQLRKGAKWLLFAIAGEVCVLLAFCSHVVLFGQGGGVRMLMVLIPALAGLALIYYLYQRDFFPCAAAVILSCVALWLVRFGRKLEALVLLAALAALAVGILVLRKKGGVACLVPETPIQLLPKSANYLLMLGSCAVGLLTVAASMVLGSTAAYYLLFVMIAWLFVLLVYYTVKMM